MAQIDPRMLMQAAMSQGAGGATGAPPDALPSGGPGAQPVGADPQGVSGVANTGGLNNVDLGNVVGTGADPGGGQDSVQQMVQLLNDPSTPPDQRAQIQMRLQLAALASLGGQPGGAGAQQPGTS